MGINLKKVIITDIKFIFNLYNQGIKENFFLRKKIIKFYEHKKWFISNYKLSTIKIWVVFYNKKKVGYVKFSIISSRSAKVSIIIDKKFRNKNIGSKILNTSSSLLNKNTQINTIYAEVLKKNIHSKVFFIKNGFKLTKLKKFKNEFEKKNLIFNKKIK
jgi:RimJ/RimL family protein N-acetyltransferase